MNSQAMIFSFLKYVKPIWYFNLKPLQPASYFVDVDKLPESKRSQLQADHQYASEVSRRHDLAYQAFHRGLISFNLDEALAYHDEPLPLDDEYYFLRKYYNQAWSWYVLVIRILELNNPIREFRGFLKHGKVKRFNFFSALYTYERISLTERPLVSIVLPTLNRYDHLENILNDLQKQRYDNFEVIVVDQSDPFQADFYTAFSLPINVIHQVQPGLWKARNNAIREAKGDYIAFTEDDVRVKPDWLEEHMIGLKTFDVDISAGVFFPQGSQPGPSQTFYHWAEQFASGNALVKKYVFSRVGLFDMQFERMRMGDGEFGLRCNLHGFKSISNPFALCEDVKAQEGGLRQMGSWDALRPTKFFAPRPIPSVNYFMRKYFGNAQAIRSLMISLPVSLIPYKYKKNIALTVLSFSLIMVLFPFYLYQVITSWRISSTMLTEKSKIEML